MNHETPLGHRIFGESAWGLKHRDIGKLDREAMLADRPQVEAALTQIRGPRLCAAASTREPWRRQVGRAVSLTAWRQRLA